MLAHERSSRLEQLKSGNDKALDEGLNKHGFVSRKGLRLFGRRVFSPTSLVSTGCLNMISDERGVRLEVVRGQVDRGETSRKRIRV